MTTKKEKAPKKPTLLVLSSQSEKFETAGASRPSCVECGLWKGVSYGKAFVPAGYTNKAFLLFGTSPTKDELDLVHWELAKAGYSGVDVAYMAAVRCPCDEPSMTQLRACRPYVLRALEVLKPELVFGLGSIAAKSLTNRGSASNIAKLRGRPFKVADSTVYVTYEPASVLKGGTQYVERIQEDLKRKNNSETRYPDNLPPVGLIAGFDTEYAPDKTLLTIGVADPLRAISVEPQDHNFYETLGHIDDIDVLCGHSVTGDVDQLIELNVAKPEWVSGEATRDSLLMSRMENENRGEGGYDLESLLVSNRNVQPWKPATEKISKVDATKWPEELRKERCRLDAWAAVSLVHDLTPKLAGMPVELTHRIAMSIHRIKHAGVYIDNTLLGTLGNQLDQERQEARAKLTIAAQGHGMTEFIPTNDEHLRDLLFNRMGLPVTKKTKKEKLAAVDKVTLSQFQDRREVQLLTAFNAADKAYSTNIEGVRRVIQPVNDDLSWMAVNINPLGARTGRRASSDPNMQNWQEKMRRLIVSRFPNGKILEQDYKSLEVFLLAFEANDSKLFEYFDKRGGYIAIAKEMWKTDVAKGTKEYRATKATVLGVNYNKQTYSMAQDFWVRNIRLSHDYKDHERAVDKLRNSYLDMFPGLRPYMDRQERYLLKHQGAVSRTGRVRHLPLTDGKDTPGYWHLVNQAINFPIQSLASDVTGSALIDCEANLCRAYNISLLEYHERLMRKDWPKMPLIINEVHDNLVFDLPEMRAERAQEVIRLIEDTMVEVKTLRAYCPSFTMKLKVDLKIGPHWGWTDED